jgi:hypothetical protein
VGGRNGAGDFGGKKIVMRPDESYQVTTAVAVGAVSDVYPTHAVRISNVAGGPGEVLDFIGYVARGRVMD